ncbi:MAG TPA: hypothetical protein VH561_07680 [Micromonosporaceae bacterium]
MRRIGPALALFLISPLVAEYLLGDLPITLLGGLFALAPLYGGGAVLIREVVRRTGRGWPSIILLALAYGLVEEGLLTQSLFNPDYLHLRLLDHGFVPALGISVPWTIFVLTLHVAWSISAPIAVTEALTRRGTRPWLRTKGVVVAGLAFLAGATFVAIESYSDGHFVATWPRLGTVAVLVALLAVVALRLPRTTSRTAAPAVSGRAPAPWLVLVLGLAAGGAFMLLDRVADSWPWWLTSAVAVAVLAGAIAFTSSGSRKAGWDDRHRLAVASAALLTYAWRAFAARPLQADLSRSVALASHIIFGSAAVALLVIAALRVRSQRSASLAVDAQPSHAGLGAR